MSALADGATAVLIIWIAHRLGWERRWAVFAGAIFAMMPLSISFAASGMESSCFTLLVVATCAAALANCRAPTGLLAASAVLMRPEGLLVAGLALGRHLIQRRKPPTCELVTLLLPVAVWAAIAFSYFGNPVP